MTTASVKERKEIFGELKQCIKGKGEQQSCLNKSYTVMTWIKGAFITANGHSKHLFVLCVFRPARACRQRTMQALLSHATQISVGLSRSPTRKLHSAAKILVQCLHSFSILLDTVGVDKLLQSSLVLVNFNNCGLDSGSKLS